MIRNEELERFILGWALEASDHGLGHPTTITPLWLASQEKCGDCDMDELLDALYNLNPNDAELSKCVGLGTEFQLVSFERRRRTPRWQDFFTIGDFRIKVLPPGRVRYQKLDEAAAVDADRKFARIAIDEARKSVPEEDNRPHPKVGAVVVKSGKMLSTAHRGERPENHAEYIALEKKLADEAVAGATVYTTLEPCTTRNHPKIPCAERLIERRVVRVVIGMLDPDDRISGRGQRRLRKAGIVTDFFPHDLMTEVEELNREFTRFCEQQGQTMPVQSLRTQPTPKAPSIADEKVAAILSHKGKTVTVMNHPKSGRYQGSDSYWPYETIVADCNSLFVTLKDSAGEYSFPLDQVDVNFDNEKKRLRLQIDRY